MNKRRNRKIERKHIKGHKSEPPYNENNKNKHENNRMVDQGTIKNYQ